MVLIIEYTAVAHIIERKKAQPSHEEAVKQLGSFSNN